MLLRSNEVYQGTFSVAIKVDDRINRPYSKCSIYGLKLYDHEKLIYEVSFDLIHYGKSPKTQMHYIRDLTHLSPTQYVYKLYQDFDKSSSYIKHIVNQGVLSEGKHHLKLVVEDFFGNTSQREFRFKTKKSLLKNVESDHNYTGDFRLIQAFPSLSNVQAKISAISEFSKPQGRKEIIQISPSFLFFMRQAQLIYSSKSSNKLYISKWDSFLSKWKALKTNIYPTFVSSNIDSTGVYAVKEDLVAPYLANVVKEYHGLRLSYSYIKASDSESGVDAKSLSLFCDDHEKMIDYDIDRKWIILDKDFGRCKEVRVKVCDFSKNCVQKVY